MARGKLSQRERLTRAMIVTAARYGYGEASVSRVVGQAGVSRATFYEHFENKEDCFLAAYRGVAERMMVDARELASGRAAESSGQFIARLMASAERHPAATRVVLIESLAASPAARAVHERLVDGVEMAVEEHLNRAGEVGRQLEIPPRGLIGAIWGIVAIRLFRGEGGRLVDLARDLDVWLASYALPAGRQRRTRAEWDALGDGLTPPAKPLPNPLDGRLPRGRTALTPAAVAGVQRLRVFAAIARVCREKGYEATTVADIVSTAGIAREAFYGQFRSKQDAFLAAQAYALESSLSASADKIFGAGSWPDRLWNGAMLTLRYAASVPDLSTLDLLESYAVGAPAIRRSYEGRMAYSLFLQEGFRQRPEAEALPRLSTEAIAGGILELMRRQVLLGRVTLMQETLPQIAYLALAPFLGVDVATRTIEKRCAETRSRPGRPSERSRARPRVS